MKLLSPVEIKTDKEKLQTLSIQRSLTLDEEIIKKSKELDRLRLEFELIISKQESERIEEQQKYAEIINALKSEVFNLEEKRKELLLPLDEKWKEIEKANEIIGKRNEKLKEKKETFKLNLESLEGRLEEVSEREQIVNKMSSKQALEQQGIDIQKEQISLQTKSLNKLIIQSNQEFLVKQKETGEKETKINLKEEELQSKEQLLLEKEKSFVTREKQINDKYATLQRAIEEYERKKRPK